MGSENPSSAAPTGIARVAYLTHPSSVLHDMGEGHPECPERVGAVHQALSDSGLLDRLERLKPAEVSDEQILRVHTPAHLERLKQTSPASGMVQLDPDTAMNEHSLTAARFAAGALVHATDAVISGQVQRAFCNLRPPGHHAESDRSMGFCLINNVAVGAAHALSAGNLQRVAIIDFDVHHGNGTEDIFAAESRVLMASTFQTPLYPGTGTEPMGPNMFNVGLAPGSDGQALRRAVEQVWLPALEKFQPELLFVSAGFDAHDEDPLAQLRWTDDDYAWVSKVLVEQANRYCQGRIVSTLEGGYALDALGRSASRHVQALLAA